MACALLEAFFIQRRGNCGANPEKAQAFRERLCQRLENALVRIRHKALDRDALTRYSTGTLAKLQLLPQILRMR
jgi:hypothetical protein